MKQLTIKDLRGMIGKYIWMFSPDYSFGGKRMLERIDKDKIWVDHESYLNIQDIGVKMLLFKDKPEGIKVDRP